MHRSLALAGVVLAVVVAGCGDDTSSSTSGSAASGSSDKPVTIGIVETESFSPYYATAKLGAESAGTEAGNAKIVVQGPVNPTAAAASNVAQNLSTSLSPDGMGVNPCILAGWTQMLNQLSRSVTDANVITWGCKPADSPESAASSPIKTFVGANDAESGYVAAKTAITEAKLGPETTGTALLGLCLQGVPILSARRSGEVKAVKELLPKVDAVEFVSKVDNAGALTAWTSALTKYPDLVYAGGACDQDAAALSTLKARGTAKDVVISAIDPTAKMLDQIKSGDMSGAVATQPWVIANVATHLLIGKARGEEMPQGWVDSGVTAITKANAAQFQDATTSPAKAKAFFGPKADAVLKSIQDNTKPMADAFAGSAAALVASGIQMDFGPVKALDDVSVEVRTGEVHALLGANGAGKSTLVKILAGVTRPTAGQLTLDGEAVHFKNGHEAVEAGIATVSQELNLFPDLSVQENLFLRREPLRGGTVVDRSTMRAAAKPVLAEVGLSADMLNQPLRSLSLGGRQLVEIARALLMNPRVLILDEPTSALKAAETQRLLDVVRNLRNRDVAVVFVSHFLEDVFKIADVVTVLRNGRVTERAKPASEMTQQSVITAMLGERGTPKAVAGRAKTVRGIPSTPKPARPLVLSGACSRGVLDPVTLTAEPGEVVGLAGLEGSGASEVLRLIFGQLPLTGGTIQLPTGQKAARSMLGAVRKGVAYVPADRKADGLILESSIRENISMVTAGPLGRLGFLPSVRAKQERAQAWRERLGVVAGSDALPVGTLSGGNQQKVVLGKWLETAPYLVLLDDPTRGVDVGAKPDLLEIVREVALSGRVVLYASTDFIEMASLCDRVLVFYRHSVIGELRPPLSEHQLLEAVTRGVLEPTPVAA